MEQEIQHIALRFELATGKVDGLVKSQIYRRGRRERRDNILNSLKFFSAGSAYSAVKRLFYELLKVGLNEIVYKLKEIRDTLMLKILEHILMSYDDLISERLRHTEIYPSEARKGLGRHISH
jgi:hypothetical protein